MQRQGVSVARPVEQCASFITIVLSTVFYDEWVNDINNLSQTEGLSVENTALSKHFSSVSFGFGFFSIFLSVIKEDELYACKIASSNEMLLEH